MTLRVFTSPAIEDTESLWLKDRLSCFQAGVECCRVLTFQQLKVLWSQAVKGLVGGRENGVGTFLLQQISQACFFHQRQENPTAETKPCCTFQEVPNKGQILFLLAKGLRNLNVYGDPISGLVLPNHGLFFPHSLSSVLGRM